MRPWIHACLLSSSTAVALSQNAAPPDRFFPEGTLLDLGARPFDSYTRDSLLLVNRSPGAFGVGNVRTDCGCTVPEWTQEPLAPGDSTYLVFEFHCRSEGGVEKEVEVWLSGYRRAARLGVRASCR